MCWTLIFSSLLLLEDEGDIQFRIFCTTDEEFRYKEFSVLTNFRFAPSGYEPHSTERKAVKLSSLYAEHRLNGFLELSRLT